jgi:CBS domain-containing protein
MMTKDLAVITADEPISAAARLMRDKNVGAVPVVQDRSSMTLKGVITDRDIAIRHVADGHRDDCRVSDHLTSGTIHSVTPETDAEEVLEVMKRQQVRRVPVVESGSRLVGIIAQADVAADQHPEKVGEVVERISEPGKGR